MTAITPPEDARLIHAEDPEFPDDVLECKPPVERLWVRGSDLRSLGPRIAIVGTRRATEYGLEMAHDLAESLARAGMCIVSGLALGIDGAAHEGAFSGGGSTIAVFGTGIDRVYPAEHRALAARVIERGAHVSEYDVGAEPYKHHFPKRNRIIAGLSLGVVLVQAGGEKSGAMGTVKAALELGRHIFAVPGDARADASQGPLQLLREGATPCARASDVLDALEGEIARAHALTPDASPPLSLEASEMEVWLALAGGPSSIDAIVVATGLGVHAVMRSLGRLEIDGLVRRLAGGNYRRVR